MQVSAVQAGPPIEIFSGFSANHAVLLTPNGLVYVEVPVFADSNTYRRLVTLPGLAICRRGHYASLAASPITPTCTIP